MKTSLGLLLTGLISTTALSGLLGAAPRDRDDLLSVPNVSRDEVICFALYTVHHDVLKLTAQLYPLQEGEERSVRLEIDDGNGWREVARAEVVELGWTATFRVDDWDSTRRIPYRLVHGESATYDGVVRRDPTDQPQLVVAAFTGNSIYPQHGGDISKQDIVENIQKLDPDLLFFSGDQVYDHNRHYSYWLKFGRDFGEVIRDRPTITIPDDHDVGHANLWGAGGKKSESSAGPDGGFFKPVEYVNMVQRAQTSHLPDPYDPTPIDRGITVYYTSLTWGRVSFAILEDRKWKTGPQGVVPQIGPRPDHITRADYDPASLDVPGAELLGERQLKFLREWSADWRGADMKCVLSQTIFCGGAHLHGQRDNRVLADLDANGWPQTGRNQALREIRKGFALMIAGDQHLATVIHHGIDDFRDAGVSFCAPSIANLYLRWWAPLKPGENRAAGAPDYTGDFLDGFGNKLTMLAVANPTPVENRDKLTTRAAGFAVVRFDRSRRKMTLECWPRNTDVSDPQSQQYSGWPQTVTQLQNYGRQPAGHLPGIEVTGDANPVVQLVAQSTGEIVYTIRAPGRSFRPPVFDEGLHTLHISEPDTGRKTTLTDLSLQTEFEGDVIRVDW